MKKINPGTIVGAGRWPQPLHASMPPWKGVVLAHEDPLAWEGTIAFSGRPSREAVRKHLALLESRSLSPRDEVPVLWDFGKESRVYWEPLAKVRPYEQDVALWRMRVQAERSMLYERCSRSEGLRLAA